MISSIFPSIWFEVLPTREALRACLRQPLICIVPDAAPFGPTLGCSSFSLPRPSVLRAAPALRFLFRESQHRAINGDPISKRLLQRPTELLRNAIHSDQDFVVTWTHKRNNLTNRIETCSIIRYRDRELFTNQAVQGLNVTAWRKSAPFLVAIGIPCPTAMASIKLSQRAWGWRLTSMLCRNLAHTKGVYASQSTTRLENSLRNSASFREISSRRASEGVASAPS